MPGIVYFGGLVVGGAVAVVIAIFVWTLVRKLLGWSNSASGFAALTIGVIVALWGHWVAFGEHHNPIDVSNFGDTFPELAENGAKVVRGHIWIDSLSDGEYYQFRMKPEQFGKFVSKFDLSHVPVVGPVDEPYEGHFSVLGGVAPDWMPVKGCTDGKVYKPIRRKNAYFSRFAFYYCSKEGTGYMAWVRI